jgi:hypothetical protein
MSDKELWAVIKEVIESPSAPLTPEGIAVQVAVISPSAKGGDSPDAFIVRVRKLLQSKGLSSNGGAVKYNEEGDRSGREEPSPGKMLDDSLRVHFSLEPSPMNDNQRERVVDQQLRLGGSDSALLRPDERSTLSGWLQRARAVIRGGSRNRRLGVLTNQVAHIIANTNRKPLPEMEAEWQALIKAAEWDRYGRSAVATA